MNLALLNIAVTFHACNWHACIHGAFGLVLTVRAIQMTSLKRHGDARDSGVAGFVHIGLAVLSFLA